MKTLVIGGTTNGIGASCSHRLMMDFGDTIVAPSCDEMDVTNPAQIHSYMQVFYPFDRIVYSAGVNELMQLGAMNEHVMASIFDTNVMGFIRVLDSLTVLQGPNSKAYDPVMPRSVVAIVSDSATTAMRHSIAYASSKAALAHAIRCAARELAPWCRVNGVSPSIVSQTEMTEQVDVSVQVLRGWTAEQARDYEMSLVPMGRRCTKAEVARLVADIITGPTFLTGAIIPITGGK